VRGVAVASREDALRGGHLIDQPDLQRIGCIGIAAPVEAQVVVGGELIGQPILSFWSRTAICM
jgi:hypothetical protein